MTPNSTPDRETLHTAGKDVGQLEKNVFWKLSAKLEDYRSEYTKMDSLEHERFLS